MSEREYADDELRETEERQRRYEFIASATHDFMTLISRDYVYEAANAAYCEAHGLAQEDVVGKSVAELWGPEAFENPIRPRLDECFAGNEVSYEEWFEFPALGRRCFEVAFSPYRADDGEVTHVAAVSRDVTELVTALERLQVFTETAGAPMAVYDREGVISMMNRQAATSVGGAPEDFIGRRITDLFPEGGEEYLQRIREVFRTEESCSYEDRVELLGKERWFYATYKPIHDRSGALQGVQIHAEDLTERKEAEEALRRSEETTNSILAAMPDLVFRMSADGTFLDYRPSNEVSPALPPEAFLGRKVSDVLPEELGRRVGDAVEATLSSGEPQALEYKLPDPLPDGEVRNFEARITRIAEEEVLAIVRDVTDARRAEEESRRQDERYRELIESSHEVFFSKDLEGRYRVLNQNAAVGLGGASPADVLGKTDHDILPKGQADAIREADHKAMSAETSIEVEETVRDASGQDRTYLTRKWPSYSRDGAVDGVNGLAIDITERRQAEEELRRHRDSLEEEVERRTEDIRKQLDLMAGREIRMAELKGVIRELREQLVQAGMTPVRDDPLRETRD